MIFIFGMRPSVARKKPLYALGVQRLSLILIKCLRSDQQRLMAAACRNLASLAGRQSDTIFNCTTCRNHPISDLLHFFIPIETDTVEKVGCHPLTLGKPSIDWHVKGEWMTPDLLHSVSFD